MQSDRPLSCLTVSATHQMWWNLAENMAQSKCKWLDAKQKQRPIRINVCDSPTLRAWTHDWLRVQTRRCIKILVGWTAETATKEIYGNIIHNAPPPFIPKSQLGFLNDFVGGKLVNFTILHHLFPPNYTGSSPDPKTSQDIPSGRPVHRPWWRCSPQCHPFPSPVLLAGAVATPRARMNLIPREQKWQLGDLANKKYIIAYACLCRFQQTWVGFLLIWKVSHGNTISESISPGDHGWFDYGIIGIAPSKWANRTLIYQVWR